MCAPVGTIFGKSGFLNYGADTGHINNGRFAYRSFVFRGRSVDFDREGYTYRKASITSCDEDPPHYVLRASRIDLEPGDHFLAYNTVFFVGKLPVFYFPILYKPFGGGTPFVSIFRPGYDQRNGSTFAWAVHTASCSATLPPRSPWRSTARTWK